MAPDDAEFGEHPHVALPSWITEALIDETQAFWSEDLGRLVGRDEAIEMLVNVKHLAEVLLKMANDDEGASQ